MGNFVEKHRKGLFIFSRSILFFLIALLLVDKFNIINVSRFVNHTFLVVLSFIFLFFYTFFYIKEDEDYYKKMFEPYSKYVFLFLLIIITLGSLQFAFLQNINWFNSLSSIIKLYQLPLVLLAVGFGFFTFYFNRDEVERAIEDEKTKEEADEKRRKEEFAYKFPRISRIWGLRSIVKWMYKEGWWYSGLLIGIVLVGFVLRVNQSFSLQFLRDEYAILENAKVLLLGGKIIYSRVSILIYLYYFYYYLFDFSTGLLFNRFPFIILSLVNVVLVYLIGKRLFNKQAGILTSLLFYLSTYSIALSLYVREYEFYLMITLIVLLILLKLKNKWRITLFFLVYSLYVLQDFITGGTLVAGYLILFCIFIYRMNIPFRNKSRYKVYGLLFVVGFISLLVFFQSKWGWLFAGIHYRLDYLLFDYFQSLNIGVIQIIMFSLGLLTLIYMGYNKKGSPLIYYFLGLMGLSIYYSLFFSLQFAPRYIYLFFVLSLFVYYPFFLNIFWNKLIKFLVVFMIILLLVSSSATYNLEKKEYNNFVGTHAYNTIELIKFIKENNLSNEIINGVVITTNEGELGFYLYNKSNFKVFNKEKGYISPENFFQLGDMDTLEANYSEIIEKNDRGIIVVDWIRGEWFKIPKKSFYIGTKNVDLIESTESYYIYSWGLNRTGISSSLR